MLHFGGRGHGAIVSPMTDGKLLLNFSDMSTFAAVLMFK
jgi:hypothetical protein